MDWKFSRFGEKMAKPSGITVLMDDLGNALSQQSNNQEVVMMGGGNPAHIELFEKKLAQDLKAIATNSDDLRDFCGIYDPPQGHLGFLQSLKRFFNEQLGWNITEDNLCLTPGSQSSFFTLFNLLAGQDSQGGFKKILLPLSPEYIGYNDVGVDGDVFESIPATIEKIGKHHFKYHLNTTALLQKRDDIGAICISRPTNPSANMVSDRELEVIFDYAQSSGVPLIVDNAYGFPFPNLIRKPTQLKWQEGMVFCMSLSKLGLPALRTGIVIADADLIQVMRNASGIMHLAPNSTGPLLAKKWLDSGEITHLCNDIIAPYYVKKSAQAEAVLHQKLKGLPYRLHQLEGSIFFWLWFEGLPLSSLELYHRLKEKGLIVVAGEYFFAGLKEPWNHAFQCLRLTYTQDIKATIRGFEILAKELKAIYGT